VESTQCGGNRGLHSVAVVAPENDAAFRSRLVAGVDEGRVIRTGIVDQSAPADRLDHAWNMDQHDVSKANLPGPIVMATFLADVENVVVGREWVASDAEGVRGVGQRRALEDADDEHR